MLVVILILTMQLAVILSSQIRKEPDTNVSNYKFKDFSTLVSTKYFVDKSLVIREILQDSTAILVTAPRGFGKSVNIDMIRRFLEIEVDDEGNENINNTSTQNYKLFTNLKIYKNHRKFFDQHFGKHPVIHIDYGPLSLINSFDDMLETLMAVIFETYNKHSYLLRVEKFWRAGFGRGYFKEYLTGTRTQKFLFKQDVENAFVDLAYGLYRYYNKLPIVLIDNYDAYFDNMIFQINPNIDKCVKLIRTLNNDLLQAIDGNVSRVFVTGSLRVTGSGLFLPENVVAEYPFLRNHEYCHYYGLTTEELRDLLARHANNNETEIKELQRRIVKHYSGYRVLGTNTEVYNTRTVLKCLVTGKHWPPIDLKNFINFFYFSNFRQEVVKLLQNRTLGIYVYNALSRDDVVALRSFHEYSFSALPSHVLDLSLYLLLELGFLTVTNQITKDVVSVRISNLEAETEFVDVLLRSSVNQFEIQAGYITSVNNLLDSFSERQNNTDEMFRGLFATLQYMFGRSSYKSKLEQDLQCVLFSIFKRRFRHVHTSVCDSTRNGSIDVLVRNHQNVSFIVETKVISDKSITNLDTCAQNAIDEIIENGYIDIIDANLRDRVVYLGLCFSTVNKKFRLRYSKRLKAGDNLNKTSSVRLTSQM